MTTLDHLIDPLVSAFIFALDTKRRVPWGRLTDVREVGR